jgi:murein DD-endopeptidase MepM/ murein hydrolase activator NlpD
MPERRPARAVAVGLVLALMVATFSMDYTVKPGDTLSRIARDHDVSLSELIALNGIGNPNLIHPGQVLRIPGRDGGEEIIHVVARGDTLARIASQYGSSISALATINNIKNPNLIRLGQQLLVPMGTPHDPNVRSGRSHIVKTSETLATIAARYAGVTAAQIARANGIIDGLIYNGTRLFLDGPDFVGKGSDTVVRYTVRSGDRLGDIAHAHGTTVTAIMQANTITNPNLIIPGQGLDIPVGPRWICPVANSSYFNDWGFPRAGGRFHEGNDLFAPRGTPVHAPVAGTVERRTGALGGNQFNLRGDDGILYIGSHLDAFGKTGRVDAGDIVGYVGNTGNAVSTSPHLHFGMYMDGVPINPYPSLYHNGC